MPEAMPIPADEQQRLDDLHRLNLMLTEPEDVYDRMTSRLAEIFDVPGVFMSFIDRDSQHYKSSVGLPEQFAETRTEPRDISICSHVVGRNDMLVVEDLAADERFKDHPGVTMFGARFYAGTPLRADSGRAVGTLCLVDNRPRQMSQRECELLQMVAEGVMAQVKLQAASAQLVERTMQIQRDLEQARRLQQFLLPPARVHGEGWRITQRYRPMAELGGDYLDVRERPDGRWAALVADVSGHGTSAALTAVMAKAVFQRSAATALSAAELLGMLNRELLASAAAGQFMSALAIVFDPAPRAVELASAGHPHPLLVAGGRAQPLDNENDLLLMLDRDVEYRRGPLLALEPGQRLLVYTDGATEAVSAAGEMLGGDGLAALAGEAAVEADGDGRRDFLDGLLARLADHTGGRFQDDVALLCIEAL